MSVAKQLLSLIDPFTIGSTVTLSCPRLIYYHQGIGIPTVGTVIGHFEDGVYVSFNEIEQGYFYHRFKEFTNEN